jgi:hypothetical protein
MSYDDCATVTALEFFQARHPNYILQLDGVEGDGCLEPPIAYHTHWHDLAEVAEEL